MTQTNNFRPEIQGLRAVAVLVVMFFHIWPSMTPGGYIGVDVFFVISGYLITGLLLREAERDGRISIGRFYARRIKRLLPAATIVLLAVTTCVSILPVVRWEGTALESIASALYFENWWLAKNAVDYLASEQAPSALQHFWSLSVEEQYYIIWPALFALAALLLPASRKRPRFVFGALVIVIGGLSLAYSIYITPRNPGLAYFATTARGWELAIGGALAVWTRWQKLPDSIRLPAGYAGLLAIALAAWTFNTSTSFPGYQALLPTLGAALVIVSGKSESRYATYHLLKSRPFQYLGDLSYSLYLWHWPVIVFYMALAGRPIGLVDGLIVLGVSTALAHQTKYLIEDRFRAPEFAASRHWMPFGFGAFCIASSLAFSGTVLHQAGRHSNLVALDTVAASDHPGALALVNGTGFNPDVPYVPSALAAVDDKGKAYYDGCIASLLQRNVRQCRYGIKDSSKRMVVVGDSHAVHWLPALAIIAEKRGWMLTAITKSACPLAILKAPKDKVLSEQSKSCLLWEQETLKQVVASKPQIVIFAQSHGSGSKITSAHGIAKGVIAAWRKLEMGGSTIIAIRDTPRFESSRPDCMTANGATIKGCSRPRTDALSAVDPLVLAAGKHPSVFLADMTDAICGREVCEPVVGNVFVWRDAHHITATYSRSLANPLDKAIGPILEAAGKPR